MSLFAYQLHHKMQRLVLSLNIMHFLTLNPIRYLFSDSPTEKNVGIEEQHSIYSVEDTEVWDVTRGQTMNNRIVLIKTKNYDPFDCLLNKTLTLLISE